ncbi:MAG TPA: hypothetical protein PLD20_31055 [Blastocatellia bacterium]|nr:hypothetical protein [Blastocatellia bacterium]HMV87300.1 hypothetical protein [Blastocatellia bacterium]HMY72555.1 hypothetical protein [Blastocatellia bacterium]HMZ22411.1 hypothetical protein [Blastocatellia bacterium]HNG32423.1 hypothetical protein [Blastocatellia bacterium]
MLDLKRLQNQWDAMEQVNLRLLREMTIEESVQTYLSLCGSLALLIEESRDFFLPERRAYLAELQERLRKFGKWKQRQDESGSKPA